MDKRKAAVERTPSGGVLRNKELGDYTTSKRVLYITALAIPIGGIAAVSALVLLRLIALFTNLFYFGRFSAAANSPAGNHLGWWAILVPVLGSLVVGLMARYGSDRIRGHGIPEAIESILLNGSRIQPRVAFLKPLSTAISIGSGGPFGAEGPIIVTGGAFGSMLAQMCNLTSNERKTLLVAGATAGMAAVFASPIAGTVLAIELLLFERKPRSIIPVAMACAVSAFLRQFLLGQGPLFPSYAHAAFVPGTGLALCGLAGVICGLVSIPLSNSVYLFEDWFGKLPVHWMWWPAIGGLVVGIGGLIFPQALGVGYDVIGQLVLGQRALQLLLGVLIVKWLIWAVALGSGTSGGVLAPVMMIGAALGGLLSYALPDMGPGFWALVGLGAMLSGTLRVPLTAIIFSVEQTHDWNMLLPLLVACIAAYAVSVLLLKRSILTEKVARRGYHLSNEYALDPLELLYAREVMRTNIVALPSTGTLGQMREALKEKGDDQQELVPIVDGEEKVQSVVSLLDLQEALVKFGDGALETTVEELAKPSPVEAYADDPLRVVVYKMAERAVTRMPVVERETRRLLGMISLADLLKARARHLEEEQRRERVLTWGSRRVRTATEEV